LKYGGRSTVSLMLLCPEMYRFLSSIPKNTVHETFLRTSPKIRFFLSKINVLQYAICRGVGGPGARRNRDVVIFLLFSSYRSQPDRKARCKKGAGPALPGGCDSETTLKRLGNHGPANPKPRYREGRGWTHPVDNFKLGVIETTKQMRRQIRANPGGQA